MVTETQQILKELGEIKLEIKEIKETMPDKEMFLTAEEAKLLEESYANESKGELISSENLKKELEE